MIYPAADLYPGAPNAYPSFRDLDDVFRPFGPFTPTFAFPQPDTPRFPF